MFHLPPSWVISVIMAVCLGVGWLVRQRRERIHKRVEQAKKRVFVSYHHNTDLQYVEKIREWITDYEFDIDVELHSPSVAIKSENESRIKAALTTKMKKADYILVIVGEQSHQSKWIEWEIDRAKAKDVKLKLAAVKIHPMYKTPPALLKTGTHFARKFDKEQIAEALEHATNDY
jgi:16S rRNA C1402 (ribose-2'-O) methylase RsmI